MFTVKFSTANEAFDMPTDEMARILRDIADRVERGIAIGSAGKVLDVNGNTVGKWMWQE